MSTYSFGPEARIKKRWEFTDTQRHGLKVMSPHFIFYFSHRSKLGQMGSRLGITVRKTLGSAPTRNQIKRWVREVFRLYVKQAHPQGDWVVVAKHGAERLGRDGIRQEFMKAHGKIAGLLSTKLIPRC